MSTPTEPLDSTATQPVDRALAEPTTSVSKVWVCWLFIASVGLWSGFFGPIQVLLAKQSEAIAPDHKETVLALVTGVGAAVSMVLNPLWGAFSDRTTSRLGRRLPWVVLGVIGGVVAMLVLSRADSLWSLVLGWALAQGSLNAMLAAITATVPDQVPTRQRGSVGGFLAIAQTLGVIAGSGIAAASIRSVRPCVDRNRWFAIDVPIKTNRSAAATDTSRRRRHGCSIARVTADRLTVGVTTLTPRSPVRWPRA
jgi:MFS family permease